MTPLRPFSSAARVASRGEAAHSLRPPHTLLLPPPTTHTTNALLSSSWTKRLITAKDHASVQINVGDVDPATGRYKGTFKTFALCGYIRDKVCRMRGCVKVGQHALLQEGVGGWTCRRSFLVLLCGGLWQASAAEGSFCRVPVTGRVPCRLCAAVAG